MFLAAFLKRYFETAETHYIRSFRYAFEKFGSFLLDKSLLPLTAYITLVKVISTTAEVLMHHKPWKGLSQGALA